MIFRVYICALLMVGICSGEVHDWGYNQGIHPDQWGKSFSKCNGKQQSPIDIDTSAVEYDGLLNRFQLEGLRTVSDVKMVMQNNGHTVQIDLRGKQLNVSGGSLPGQYIVGQFHFHWGTEEKRGSEHAINGKHYPMEMHVVTYSQKYDNVKDAMAEPGGLAVLGFFIEVGNHNEQFETIINHLHNIDHKDDHVKLDSFYLTNLFPSTKYYYRYYGSLTTPPCYESVIWTIFKEQVQISELQLNRFRALGQTLFIENGDLINNYRNPQPLYGRKVTSNDKRYIKDVKVGELG